MSVKIVFHKDGFILRECSYTEDAANLYRKFSVAKAKKPGFGSRRKLFIKMSKTMPRGRVWQKLRSIETESIK